MKNFTLFVGTLLFGLKVLSPSTDEVIAKHLRVLDGNPVAVQEFYEEQGLGWLVDTGDSDEEDDNNFSSIVTGSSELLGFLDNTDPETQSQQYFNKIKSIIAADTPQQYYLLYSSLMACTNHVKKDPASFSGVVDQAVVKFGADQVRSNFCTVIDEQMNILQAAKKSFDKKRKEDSEGTRYRIGEIDRSALKGCLSAMACLYFLDGKGA